MPTNPLRDGKILRVLELWNEKSNYHYEIKIYFSELIEELKKQSNEKNSPRNTGRIFFSDNIQAINETCLIFIASAYPKFSIVSNNVKKPIIT